MSKAERKLPEMNTHQIVPGSLLDGLVLKSPQSKKPRKTKKDGSPTWDQVNSPFRYDLTDPEVYYAVAGIATQLEINNISTVAVQLIDFALAMYDQGKIWMESHPNPNPKSTQMVLTWEKIQTWSQPIKPDRTRKQRQKNLIAPPRKRTPFGFRWGRDVHNRLKSLAAEYNVALGAMVTRLLAYAVEEYSCGRLKLSLQAIASQEVSGWSTI
jgi:hypothetical protein